MNGEATNAAEVPSIPHEETAEAAVAVATPEARRLRLCELALVVGVAFLTPTLSSLVHWWSGAAPTPDRGLDGLYRILRAALSISVLAYVLYRQGRSLRTIGLTAQASDVPWALAVTFCAKLVAGGLLTLFVAYQVALPKGASLAAEPTLLKWLAVLPSAAMEELIVRAYLMTEVAALSGSMALAVIVSVSFQCFYHLYQGLPAALYHAATFFAYAVFYASTRRATPVVLAHALENFLILAR
ncbi:MAG TPA: CPBP family intramembrane glutamic endopeptidase [Thermoanaerobaculia bacterium]|jgi:membrane protease YdiL (CAAX protease family)